LRNSFQLLLSLFALREFLPGTIERATHSPCGDALEAKSDPDVKDVDQPKCERSVLNLRRR
jgi:hypothetical protein